jgi:N-acetylmuramoyl-L-alanine amidase
MEEKAFTGPAAFAKHRRSRGADAVLARWAFLFLIVVGCAQAHPALAAGTAVVTATRLEGDAQRARLVLELDGPAQARVFTLADPYRVVLDLPDVVFAPDLPEPSAGPLVSAYRYGLIAPGRSRVVIDSDTPLGAEQPQMLIDEDGTARISIDLTPTTEAAFLQTLREGPRLPDDQTAAEEPKAEGAEHKPLITIDPGHGGIDSGARSRSGDLEKDVVLQFSRTLRDQLLATGRYRVVMTRDNDSFVPLKKRVKIARDNQANLFISVHADSMSSTAEDVRGATIYTLSDKASDREAEKLAEKENRADIIAGVDLADEPDEVASILIDLAHRETKVFSSRFAQTLHGSIKSSITMNKNPLRSAGFMVLKSSDVPSVLLELGYMSSRDDLKLLTSRSWRERAATSMTEAVDAFFGARQGGGLDGGVN